MSLNLLEVGSSELLNFPYPADFTIKKTTRNSITSELFYDALNSDTKDLLSSIYTMIDNDELDLLVFSIATNRKSQFHKMSVSQFKNDFKINFFSIIEVIHGVINFLLRHYPNRRFSFLFINSTAGLSTYPNHSSYSVAKAALRSLHDNLSEEYLNTELKFFSLFPEMVSTKLSNYRGTDPKIYFEQVYIPQLNEIKELMNLE